MHPRAWLGQYAHIWCGSVIYAEALIIIYIHIGEHGHINIGSTIGHDEVLNDFVLLNPSATTISIL